MTEQDTGSGAPPARFAIEAARQAPIPEGARSALLAVHGSMKLRFYQPRGHDPQTPHEQDEIYVVAQGRGTFLCEGRRCPFEQGDALFARAGAEHRFEDFSDDLQVWVVFYGPRGGEAASTAR